MHISEFLLNHLYLPLLLLFLPRRRTLFWTPLRTVLWTVLRALFRHLRRRLLLRSIAVIKLVSFFLFLFILLEGYDRCGREELFMESVSFVLCLFEPIRGIEFIHAYVFFEMKIF